MKSFSVSQFKALCLGLLDKVSKTGQPILITKKGIPIAQVIPPPPVRPKNNWLGCLKGTATLEGDITASVVDSNEWEVLKK